MFNITLAKLQCNPDIRGKVMAIQGKYLLEAIEIKYWGEGYNQDGNNEIRKILMEVCDGPYFTLSRPTRSQHTAHNGLPISTPLSVRSQHVAHNSPLPSTP